MSGGVGLGVQGGCERRIEVFVKIQKKKFGGGSGGSGGGSGMGGQGECERRIEVFVKIQKKNWGRGVGRGGSGWGARVDVNEEFKFLGKFTKKTFGGRMGGLGGGSGCWGVHGGCQRNVGGRG